VRQRRLGRFVAIDQDRRSIELVSQSASEYGVEALCMSAADLMREAGLLGSFDLVYALGLYDYLSVPSAKLLTLRLFGLLNSGGMLLLANFMPGIIEAGYMEAFMRWNLIYRTPDDLRELCALLPDEKVACINVWAEDARNIAYVTVTSR
jgi:hypothetical protein